jgi:Tfp pilus assembly protein PilF
MLPRKSQQQGKKMRKQSLLLLLAVAVLVAGCAPPPLPEVRAKIEEWVSRLTEGEAQSLLASGLKYYEEGEYDDAAGRLNAALIQGLPVPERVSAHKHLAFIYCTADLEPACRSEFRKALIADPAMDLEAAEAGHPAWGPVFHNVKIER